MEQWLLDCGITSSVITPTGSANVAFLTTLINATEMVLSCDSRVLDNLVFFRHLEFFFIYFATVLVMIPDILLGTCVWYRLRSWSRYVVDFSFVPDWLLYEMFFRRTF
jgi:hypothetical protein